MRCPDIAAIKQQLADSRKKLFICQFGISESDCKTWLDFQMLQPRTRLNMRCYLCQEYEIKNNKRVYKCAKAQERYNNSLKQKNFKIDNSNYRKIASAAHYLMKTSKTRTLFLLLTFPQWKKNFNPYKNENKLNDCFSKFVKNMRENYHCSGYIAVRELGKEHRRYHYHILLSIPFIDFAIINNAWCAAISDICDFSKNALSSNPENRLINRNNPARAVRYVCKYISKSKNQSSKSRIIFISENLYRKPVPIRNTEYSLYNKTGVMTIENYLLSLKHTTVNKINDYCTAFRINDNAEFNKFCYEIIYPMYNLSAENSINLNAYPDKKPPPS